MTAPDRADSVLAPRGMDIYLLDQVLRGRAQSESRKLVFYSLFFMLRAALTGRWPVARVGALALADGLRGRFGGQNERIAGVRLNPPAPG